MPRVLYVDSFGGSAKSRSAAKRSLQTVRTAVKSLTEHGVCPLDFEVKVAHASKLDRYTLSHPAGHEQVLREIDKLDVVVLDGDSSMLPWSPILDPIATFVRMCVSARKCVFAAGRAANVLAFVLANGPRGKPFTVVNGDGVGTPLGELDNFRAEDFHPSSAENFAFLDSDTGDLYLPRGNQWVRQSSVGNTYGANAPPPARLSRSNRGAGGSGSRSSGGGAAVTIRSPAARAAMMARPSSAQLRPPKPPVNKAILTPFVGRGDEMLTLVRPECRPHVLFRGMDVSNGFLARRRKGVAVADPRVVRHCSRRFRTLAVEQGSDIPVVFEYQNAVGCSFYLDRKYPGAAAVLQNYLVDRISKIVDAGGHIDLRLHNTDAGTEAKAQATNAASRRAAQSRAQAARLLQEGEDEEDGGGGGATDAHAERGHKQRRQQHHGGASASGWGRAGGRSAGGEAGGGSGGGGGGGRGAFGSRPSTGTTARPLPVGYSRDGDGARQHRVTWTPAEGSVNRSLRPFSARMARNEEELKRAAETHDETVQRSLLQEQRSESARQRPGCPAPLRQPRTRADSDPAGDDDVAAFLGDSDSDGDGGHRRGGRTKTRKSRLHQAARPGSQRRTVNSQGQVVVRTKQHKRPPSKSYARWRRIDKERGGQSAFFSVVQGSPYESPFEKEMREAKESKQHWVVQEPFATTSGKRSAMGHDEKFRSIHAGSDYNPPGCHQFRAHKPDKQKFAAGEWRFV